MRRAVLLAAMTTAALLTAGGVALALNVIKCESSVQCEGTKRSDLMKGNDKSNIMYGLGKHDVLKGFGGNDFLLGWSGNDRLLGADGEDDLKDWLGDDVLKGGNGSDNYELTESNNGPMGHDRIVDTSNGDNQWKTGNTLTLSRTSASGRTINLNSDPVLPEMTNTDGTGTANWEDDAIDLVDITSGGGSGHPSPSDTVVGNDVANYVDDGDPDTSAPPQNDADNISGAGGDDLIYVDDNDGDDTVDCGEDAVGDTDNDKVYYDDGDVVTNCETTILVP